MKISDILEGALLHSAFLLFSALPPRQSSQLGGWLMLAISPLFSSQNKQIHKHLNLFMPGADHKKIRQGLWQNLGMVFGEYPHLGKALDRHLDFKISARGLENLVAENGKPAMYASAHLGNWEILPVIAKLYDHPFHPVFRPPNNKIAARLLEGARSAKGRLSRGFPKGMAGLRDITAALRKGESIGMLLDQRHSGGIPISLFGRMADTTPAAIDLARKFNACFIPGRIIRNGACDFTLEILPAIPVGQRTSEEVMTELYMIFEKWIMEYPEQWLWMHRRWGKKL